MTLEEATALVTELAFARSDVASLLTASAGTDSSDATVFRPHAVAAILWGSGTPGRRLISADGATLGSPRETAEGLLGLQESADEDLTVPDAWTVAALRRRFVGSSHFEPVF